MNRRTLAVAAVVVAVAVLTTSMYADEPKHIREKAVPESEFQLRAFFDRAPGVISEGPQGITVGAFAVNVLVARIDDDGNLVSSCVDNEAAARRFFQVPVETIDPRQKKEQ